MAAPRTPRGAAVGTNSRGAHARYGTEGNQRDNTRHRAVAQVASSAPAPVSSADGCINGSQRAHVRWCAAPHRRGRHRETEEHVHEVPSVLTATTHGDRAGTAEKRGVAATQSAPRARIPFAAPAHPGLATRARP